MFFVLYRCTLLVLRLLLSLSPKLPLSLSVTFRPSLFSRRLNMSIPPKLLDSLYVMLLFLRELTAIESAAICSIEAAASGSETYRYGSSLNVADSLRLIPSLVE